MDSDLDGYAHLVYESYPPTTVSYRMWDGSAWTTPVAISLLTRWQGWPNMAADVDGVVYAVYDNSLIRDTPDQISFVSSADE